MGGKNRQNRFVYCCRANVYFVLNLTHVHHIVQFVCVQNCEIPPAALWICETSNPDLKLNYQSTEFRLTFNRLFALTPLMSAIIISVSVRSAELRLVLYV